MTLLEFARGPALTVTLTVFVLGTLWRIFRLLSRPAPPDRSAPRVEGAVGGALHGIVRRFWPHPRFGARIGFSVFIGYLYHVGLAVIVFAYLPHIEFIRKLIGVGWPALPAPVTYFAGGVTMFALLIALMLRLTDPVKRLLSRFDDYFSWLVLFLPVATGMAAFDTSAGGFDQSYIAVHLLTVELLLLWFPFGKLMHAGLAFWSRGMTGVKYGRRGAMP